MQEQFLKLLIIGDSGVGKSCILSRFCQNKFTEAFYNTIGVDFVVLFQLQKTKTLTLDGAKCKLQIWDTAGQQRFRTITSNYYKGAHGIIIVFDLTVRESFESIRFWLDQIEGHGNQQASVILIGNKNDRQEQRVVKESEAVAFARKNGLDYIQSSAFNSLNINLVFQTIVLKVLRQRGEKSGSQKQLQGGKEGLKGKGEKRRSGCC